MTFSNSRQLSAYPSLRRLVKVQLDMQLEDVKTLLKLPQEDNGLPGGCNLTLASLLFNVIAGSSVLFHEASWDDMKAQRGRGKRFKETLERHYPFGPDDLPAEDAAKVLYEAARNPLTHSLGVGGAHIHIDGTEDEAHAALVHDCRPGKCPKREGAGSAARPKREATSVFRHERQKLNDGPVEKARRVGRPD